MTTIHIDEFTKTYGESPAVDDLDLEIDGGEVYALVGPNGSGKTTVLEALAGLIAPTEGTVSIDGRPVGVGEVGHEIGFVPEDVGAYDELTAREHLEFVLGWHDGAAVPEELLDRVGLAGAADRPVGGYSGGMVKRLGLALALAGDPDLLLLDEPFRALDVEAAETVESVVRQRRDAGLTTVLSTHQFEYVERCCDGACLLTDGEVVAEGPVEALCGDTRLVVELDGTDTATMRERLAAPEGVEAVRQRRDGESVVVRGSLDGCREALAAVDGTAIHLERPSLTPIARERVEVEP